MSARKPEKRAGIEQGYEKMLQAERIAGDRRLSRGTRIKAGIAAEMMRKAIEEVPDNE